MDQNDLKKLLSGWAAGVMREASANVPSNSGKSKDPLRKGLRARVRVNADGYSSIGFSFPYHGIALHFGVGRGYVRQGGTVVRKYSGKKTPSRTSSAIKRKPVNWLDSVIEREKDSLADLALKYYGDSAMRQVLETYDRLAISKK
jgi:hypothetical protein